MAETGPVGCAPTRAQAWLDGHEGDLGGLRPGDVVALIERAGLEPCIVPYASGGTTGEQRPERVNLRLTRDGELGAVDAG